MGEDGKMWHMPENIDDEEAAWLISSRTYADACKWYAERHGEDALAKLDPLAVFTIIGNFLRWKKNNAS
jgi:hypothetical protein